MYSTRVLACLALVVGLAQSFSWDVVVSEEKRLAFYYNEKLTHTENLSSANEITAITYDPVHYRVLFADHHNTTTSIYSFDLTTKDIQPIVTRTTDFYFSLAYDPVTQLLFWKENMNIYSLSLKPASSNIAVDERPLVKLYNYCSGIAVDSCGGYIYWVTDYEIERASFDGSEREVLIDNKVLARRSLAIDQQTKKMYWIEEITFNQYSIESADLNGGNRRTFYFIGNESWASAIGVSKDFIYWRSYNEIAILQLPKNQKHGVEPIVYSQSNRDCWTCQLTAANYTVQEQDWRMESCEALDNLLLDMEKCYDSICQNYCFQGNCSVSAEGHPTCRCDSGYSGERCDVAICKDYCLQGDCSVDTEGQPKCRCNAGYSGDRCEVSQCRGYCLNNGVCSLDEEDAPVCQCSADYEGVRCEFPAVVIKCFQTISMLKEMLSADASPVTLSKGVRSTCASTSTTPLNSSLSRLPSPPRPTQ